MNDFRYVYRQLWEYLQTTGRVQHIVNLLTIDRKWQKTQVSEQRSLEGSRGPD